MDHPLCICANHFSGKSFSFAFESLLAPDQHASSCCVPDSPNDHTPFPTVSGLHKGTIRNISTITNRFNTHQQFFLSLFFAKSQLIPAGTRIEQNSNIRNVNISCTFHNPKNVLEQSVDCDIDVIRQIKEMKVNYTAHTSQLALMCSLLFSLPLRTTACRGTLRPRPHCSSGRSICASSCAIPNPTEWLTWSTSSL